MKADELLQSVRSAALSHPGAYEKLSHGAPCFFIEKKGQFGAFIDNHHGVPEVSLWLAAPAGLQESLIEEDSDRYFRPPYVGAKGWLGVRLERGLDWKEIEDLIELGYQTIASKKR